jgi:hypothetical protein
MSISEYCKDPSEHSDLPEETKAFYDNICLLRKAISRDWVSDLKNVGNRMKYFPLVMLEGLFTPRGLAMLSAYKGVEFASKWVFRTILNSIARQAGEEVTQVIAEMAAEKGLTYASSAMISTVLRTALEEGTMLARLFSFVADVGEAVSIIFAIFTVIQLLTMIVDFWDPEGYGNEMNADTMDALNEQYNLRFPEQFLPAITTFNDEFGRKIQSGAWPVEFYADYIIGDLKEDYYKDKHAQYFAEYIDKLTVNSNGEPIVWPKEGGELINQTTFQRIADKYSLMLADQNTVVSNWFNKYIIIAIGIVILLVIFLLLIK